MRPDSGGARLPRRAGARHRRPASTTGPTSTRRAIPGCSTRDGRSGAQRRPARAVVPGARQPRHPGRRRDRADRPPRARPPPATACWSRRRPTCCASCARRALTRGAGRRAAAQRPGRRRARPSRPRPGARRSSAPPTSSAGCAAARPTASTTRSPPGRCGSIVLDLVRRDAGGGGRRRRPRRSRACRRALRDAGDRPVLVAVHQPLDADGGRRRDRSTCSTPTRASSPCVRRPHAPQRDRAAPLARRRLLADHHRVDRRLAAAVARAAARARPRRRRWRWRRGWSTTPDGPTTRTTSPASRATSRSSTRRAAARPRPPGRRRRATCACTCQPAPLRAPARPGRPRPLPPPRAAATLGAGDIV